MQIIDGKKIASEIKSEIKAEITKYHLKPTLAVLLINDLEESAIYVRNKVKAGKEVGIDVQVINFTEDNTEEEIVNCINKLNKAEDIDGIIIQSPIYTKFNEAYLSSLIAKEKDVDGFGLMNMGYLATNQTQFLSATPYGIIKMLEKENITIPGKHAVIIGRSNIVGRPLALALLNRDATVTIAHSKTKNLQEITKMADILIVAIGKPCFITQEYLKKDAIVIDVGINRLNGKLCGDVDFENVKDMCSYITPVPGGVGPMTVTMLLYNVLTSAKRKEEKKNGQKN